MLDAGWEWGKELALGRLSSGWTVATPLPPAGAHTPPPPLVFLALCEYVCQQQDLDINF